MEKKKSSFDNGCDCVFLTRSTPIPLDTFLDDISESLPGFVKFALSDETFQLNADYLSVISSIRRLSSCLSVPCIIYNVLLLTVLALDKDFRSWQFFPMILQCGMDAIGPGLANIVYNYQLENKAVSMNDLPVEFIWTEKKVPLKVLSYFGCYGGYDACAWTYLREIFNELSTEICVCATGLYPYLLVCHPTYKVEDTFYKKGAVVIGTILVLEIVTVTTDFALNNAYQIVIFEFQKQRFQYHHSKTNNLNISNSCDSKIS